LGGLADKFAPNDQISSAGLNALINPARHFTIGGNSLVDLPPFSLTVVRGNGS
jgi:hypothetical protein